MIPLFIGVWEGVILLAILVLLVGGTKLAGLGKGAGKALREFKEETRSLSDDAKDPAGAPAEGDKASEKRSDS